MKNIKQYLFLSIFVLINLTQSEYISKDDGYYLVYIDNTYGESKSGTNRKRQEPEEFVTTVMEEIQQLIVENKDTFKNPEELNNLEENNASLKKRNGDTSYVREISSIDDTTVLSSFFSYEVNEKVKNLPGVLGSEPKRKMTFGLPIKNSRSFFRSNKEKRDLNNDSNINDNNVYSSNINNEYVNKVKSKTGWKGIEVRENADLHLSLLSQGLFNGTLEQYDTTYYYPKSGGENIDIYVIDSGFNFRHAEFSNKEKRITKCLGILSNGELIEPESDDFCISDNYHGELTSDCVGGIRHGVASNANVYGIALTIEGREGEESNNESFILALDYILNNIKMKRHKSVISLSMGGMFSLKDVQFYNYMQRIFNRFYEAGVITVVSAGNGGEKVFDLENDKIYLPCALNSVICVGGIDSNGSDRDPYISNEQYMTKMMDPINYVRANFSNYGDQVNIYAPGYANAEFQDIDYSVEWVWVGTSFATPLVAGLAATIMSERSDINFDVYSMNSYLTLNGQRNILGNIPEGVNVFANNGNKSVYMRPSVEENIENNTIENENIENNTIENENIENNTIENENIENNTIENENNENIENNIIENENTGNNDINDENIIENEEIYTTEKVNSKGNKKTKSKKEKKSKVTRK